MCPSTWFKRALIADFSSSLFPLFSAAWLGYIYSHERFRCLLVAITFLIFEFFLDFEWTIEMSLEELFSTLTSLREWKWWKSLGGLESMKFLSSKLLEGGFNDVCCLGPSLLWNRTAWRCRSLLLNTSLICCAWLDHLEVFLHFFYISSISLWAQSKSSGICLSRFTSIISVSFRIWATRVW